MRRQISFSCHRYSLPTVVEITTKELTEGNMGPSFIDTTVVGWFSSEDIGE